MNMNEANAIYATIKRVVAEFEAEGRSQQYKANFRAASESMDKAVGAAKCGSEIMKALAVEVAK